MVTLEDLIKSGHTTTGFTFSNAVVKAAADAVIKQKTEKGVQAVQGLISEFDATLRKEVAQLRFIREQETAQKKKVADVDRAFRYFAATGNPLPMLRLIDGTNCTRRGGPASSFCDCIGITLPKHDDPAWTVPADWTEAAVVAPAEHQKQSV